MKPLSKSYKTSEQREKSNARSRKYYLQNKAKCNAAAKRYREANPERVRALSNRWAREKAKDPEYRKRANERLLAWRNANRDRHNANERRYKKLRKETDLNFLIRARLRSRLSTKLRQCKARKTVGTMALTGCTAEFLRGYIEARFQSGMTWQNIHIDHHIPCAEFDLRDPDQQRQCFHYSNLRPLFAYDNKSKKDKMPETHQAELI